MNKLKKIRIDFQYFGSGFNPEDNFFIKLLQPYFDITVTKDRPDFVFFSVFHEIKTDNKIESAIKKIYVKSNSLLKKTFPGLHSSLKKSDFSTVIKKEAGFVQSRFSMPVLKGDFVKIFYTGENLAPDMGLCDWAFSFCYDEEFKHPHHMRLPNYLTAGNLTELIKQTDPREILKSKIKFCNFVYSNEVGFRNKFFEKLNHYKRVDAPGRCMNNMPPIGHYDSPLSSRFGPDWNEAKIHFLKDYKFTIAFENESYPGYVTEKIVHPMLANSIPIYFGNKFVGRDFNKKSFLFITDPDNLDELIEKVIELDRDDEKYISMMKEPWLINNQKNKYMDNDRLLQRFKTIFNSR